MRGGKNLITGYSVTGPRRPVKLAYTFNTNCPRTVLRLRNDSEEASIGSPLPYDAGLWPTSITDEGSSYMYQSALIPYNLYLY